MGNLTKNISDYELKCKCGKCQVTIQAHEPVIGLVQSVCDYYSELYKVDRVKLVITSAARCYEYNRVPASEGGPGSNDHSQHPRCNAIDFKIFAGDHQIPPIAVFNHLNAIYENELGVGLYRTFIHIDNRPSRHRWDRT